MLIADLTKAYAGTELRFLAIASTHAQESNQDMAVLIHARQQRNITSFPGLPSNCRILPLDDWLPPDQIAAQARDVLILPFLRQTAERIELVSFHEKVLGITWTLPAAARERVLSLHWFKISGPPPGMPVQSSLARWSEKAISEFAQTLRNFPHGLRQNALREVLAGLSNEFVKKPGSPQISSLVAIARARGLVEIFNPGDINPLIQVRSSTPEDGSRLSAPPEAFLSQSPLPDAIACDRAVPANPLRETPSQITVSSAPPLPNSLQAEAASTAASTAAAAAEQCAITKTASPPAEAQTGQPNEAAPSRVKTFYELLKKANLGPFSRERGIFYAEILRLVELKKDSANRIIAKAARRVVIQNKLSYPWSAAELFLSALFHRQPVLLDNNGIARDPLAVSSFNVPITKVTPKWTELLDSELVYHLVEADGQISVMEIETIAFVLFPGLSEDERNDRVESLFALLSEAGRIETAKGVFKVLKRSAKSHVMVMESFKADPSGPTPSVAIGTGMSAG